MSTTSTLAGVLPAEALASLASFDFTATGSAPEAIVVPGSTEEVAQTLRWAEAAGRGVLPFGGGHALRPVVGDRPWIALSTTRLTGVEIYEAADLTITVGAGTPVAELDRVLRDEGQWAPFDPPGARDGTVGGLVARGFSGPLQAGYGELRNHVLGATLVTGDGRILRLGGRVVKNVAGYDLLKPLVGSLGSLGVMTSICLRTFPQPAMDRVFQVMTGVSGHDEGGERTANASEAAAPVPHPVGALAQKVATAPVVPASSVVVDRTADAGGPTLFVRLHGSSSTVDADRACIEAHLGTTLEEVAPDRVARDGLLEHARDRSLTGPVRLRLTALPSRIARILSSIAAVGEARFTCDVLDGSFDLSIEAGRDGAIRDLSGSVESVGGAVRTVAAPPGDPAWQLGTGGAPEVDQLLDMVRLSYDPTSTLWPTHRP